MQELRTTTGQRVEISYDPTRNAVTFHETDWFADPLRSTGVPVKSDILRPLGERGRGFVRDTVARAVRPRAR